jgi:lipopolysaccharide transport system ATP-binding protein
MIHVEDIGKRYRLGAGRRHDTLRDLLAHGARGLFGGRGGGGRSEDAFWALRHVSFDVAEGEVVGIIGKNGAGKSTLLKLMSRITPPTEGRIRLNGRVASLLEVGTGFHPELTGRENVFMNGAILGMRQREIKAKLDEIVAFSEVEKFIDTPVKHYSSGMYVRLAFAVAAHLEPEILIVDEVLAVGDAEFQKKCLGKMGEVAQGGRTVLFVSHNMAAIRRLCDRSVLLEKGKMVFDGPSEETVAHYLSSGTIGHASAQFPSDPKKGEGQILAIALVDEKRAPVSDFDANRDHYLRIDYELRRDVRDHRVSLTVESAVGELVFTSYSSDFRKDVNPAKAGSYRAEVRIPALLLNPGEYVVTSVMGEPRVRAFDQRERAVRFRVEGYNLMPRQTNPGAVCGGFFEWKVREMTQVGSRPAVEK